MNTGSTISGAGHLALLTGLLLGGWLGSDPPLPPETTDVSIITEREFAALALPQTQPETQFDVPTPALPDTEDSLAPAPRPEDPPVTGETAGPETPDAPDPVPDVPETPLRALPELADDLPELAVPEPLIPDIPTLAPPDDTPAPQQAPRVAPVPAPESPPSPEIADTPTPRVSPEAETPQAAEDQPEAAPEEATTEIVTEAESPASAPLASPRPLARPVRQAAVQPEPEPDPEPEPEPEPETETTGDPTADAIADAVADAVNSTEPEPVTEPARPTGPPLTRGEKDGLRVAVQQCWNVGSLSSEALEVTVVVSFSISRNGQPDAASIRMRDYFGGSDAASRQAFVTARRAIIRCGASGYDLPIEKYEQWREIEMTFNPERMRIK